MSFCAECGTPLPANAQGGFPVNSSNEPAPTVFSGAIVNPATPPPQFNQNFSVPPQTSPPKSSNLPVILLLAAGAFVLLVAVAGVAGVMIYLDYSKDESYVSDNGGYKSTDNTPVKTAASNNSKNTPSTAPPDPVLFGSRNGFNTSFPPYNKPGDDYPGAVKTKAQIYSTGGGTALAKVIHGESSVYLSKEAASDGFDKHIAKMTDKSATITEKGTVKETRYVYYRINGFYDFCVAAEISVVCYGAQSMADLQNFLK